LLGLDIDEALDKTDDELWPPELAGVYKKNDQTVFLDGKPFEGIEPILQNGEPRSWMMYKFSVVEGESQQVFLGAVGVEIADRGHLVLQSRKFDGANSGISEQPKTEEALRESERLHQLSAVLEQRVRDRTAQLEATHKEMEAFAYSVSHDLRAPLRGIAGWSEVLHEDYGKQLDQRGSHYLGRVRSEAQRMGRLIDDILRLSRISHVQMKRDLVDLTGL